MTPIFTEKESNGIYEANLTATIFDKVSIGNKCQLDLDVMSKRETKRLLDLGISLKAASVQVDIYLDQEKKSAIAGLYTDFNNRVKLEKQFYEKDKQPT